VTYRVEVLYADEHVTLNPKRYTCTQTITFFTCVCLCVQHDIKESCKICFMNGSMYPSYRLANVLRYQQKLVARVQCFMILGCCCCFNTTANIPYCGCETCSKTIPEHFVDTGYMCSDILFLNSDKR
jgi:hypothetical protein